MVAALLLLTKIILMPLFFSKQDLTFNGTGNLIITSPNGNGIVGKDDLVFTGGNYTINTSSHGIEANDSVRITGTTQITVDAGKDGIHCENNDDTSLGFIYISAGTLNIEAEGDGISASAYMQIVDGTFSVLAGGGSENGSSQSSNTWGAFYGRRYASGTAKFINTATTEDSTSMKGIKTSGTLNIFVVVFKSILLMTVFISNSSITIYGTFELASVTMLFMQMKR